MGAFERYDMYDNIGIYCRQYNGEELGVFNSSGDTIG